MNTTIKLKHHGAGSVKAVSDGVVDVRGVPFGSPASKDAHGEYFTPSTDLWLDRIPKRAIAYAHGWTEAKPEAIGQELSFDVRDDGVWFQVQLDMNRQSAVKTFEDAQLGKARASTGAIGEFVRIKSDGEIVVWAIGEISVFDGSVKPANEDAIVIPSLKALWSSFDLEVSGESLETMLARERKAKVNRVKSYFYFKSK